MTENISKYFDSPVHSDITIRFGEESIKAHKIILCQGSEYFRAALEGDFVESKTTEIELKEDDPAAIRGVVAWLYGLRSNGITMNTDGRGYYVDPNSNTVDIAFCAKYLVHLYVTAGKYLVPALRYVIFAPLDYAVDLLVESGQFLEYLGQIATLMYLTYPQAAIGLRKQFVLR